MEMNQLTLCLIRLNAIMLKAPENHVEAPSDPIKGAKLGPTVITSLIDRSALNLMRILKTEPASPSNTTTVSLQEAKREYAELGLKKVRKITETAC